MKIFIIAAILSLSLAGPVLAQTSNVMENQSALAAKPIVFHITGKFSKQLGTYIIRQDKPVDRFAIMNPDPEILDPLVKSGKTVTIEAVSVVGDNVNIRKIDGEPYKAKAAKDEVK